MGHPRLPPQPQDYRVARFLNFRLAYPLHACRVWPDDCGEDISRAFQVFPAVFSRRTPPRRPSLLFAQCLKRVSQPSPLSRQPSRCTCTPLGRSLCYSSRTYTVEWTGASDDARFEIDLYYCNSMCMEVRPTPFHVQHRSWEGLD